MDWKDWFYFSLFPFPREEGKKRPFPFFPIDAFSTFGKWAGKKDILVTQHLVEYNFSALGLIMKCKEALFSLDLFYASVLTFISLLVKVVLVSVGNDTDTKPEAKILTNTDTDTETSIGCSLPWSLLAT